MTETRNVKMTRGRHTQRERVWLALRAELEEKEEATFGRRDLEQKADGVSPESMTKTLQILKESGVIERVGTDPEDRTYAVYRLTEDVDGFPESISTRVLAWRQQVWNVLRIQRTATVPDIESTFHEVDPADDTVYRYLRRLEKASYVRRAGRSGPKGQVMSHLKWMLVRDTGPAAPDRDQLNQEIREQETDESG